MQRERELGPELDLFSRKIMKQNINLIINMDIKMDNLLHEPPWIQNANKGLKGYY